MMKRKLIASLTGRQILDSRGNPTVEARVELNDGTVAHASVPSGASTGAYEAVELRDGGNAFGGKGVMRAVGHIDDDIQGALMGQPVDEQGAIDRALLALDGTPDKGNLGANATLAVSLACAKAAAKSHGLELFQYLGGPYGVTLPAPMMNILNGGAHASNNLDIQEFMIQPLGAGSFSEALRMGTETYAALGKLLRERGLSTTVGDEGGYAPNLESDEMALDLLCEAIRRAGYDPGVDLFICLDAAASEWAQGEGYRLPKAGKSVTRAELIDHFTALAREYPIASMEDPLSEEDWQGFQDITETLGGIQIVGDDLFVTNPERLRRGISLGAANAILIKPNQIGTLSETLEAARVAQRAGYGVVLSHRSGDTEDTSIADIAVACNAGQIKTGAPARSERVAKYNRLLRIEAILGRSAAYGK